MLTRALGDDEPKPVKPVLVMIMKLVVVPAAVEEAMLRILLDVDDASVEAKMVKSPCVGDVVPIPTAVLRIEPMPFASA